MDMEKFITRISEKNFGVMSFNTYMHDGINHCFIMIAERGNTGIFMKEECLDIDLNNTLQKMLDSLERNNL